MEKKICDENKTVVDSERVQKNGNDVGDAWGTGR